MKIGPKPHQGVWLTGGWARTAHRYGGEKDHTTACGRAHMKKRAHGFGWDFLGVSVRWDSLDQTKIALCKVCWKGYKPVHSQTMYELIWWNEQHKRVGEIFREAWTVISTPTHLDQFNKDTVEPGTGPGGNVVFQGTMLNYDTLKSMLTIMLQEETHRKTSRTKMAELMTELGRWENEHPYGEPITEDPQTFDVIVGILPT